LPLRSLSWKRFVIRGAHDQLHADLLELLGVPVEHGLAAHPGGGGIEVDEQRLAALGVTAAGITGLGQQCFCGLDRFPVRRAVNPVVYIRIDAVPALAVTENARRYRPCAGMPRPFWKIEMYSSSSIAIEMARRSFRARSP